MNGIRGPAGAPGHEPVRPTAEIQIDRTGKWLYVTNRGDIAHDFKIAGKKTKIIRPGKSASLTVRLSGGRKYKYVCTLPGHAASGRSHACRPGRTAHHGGTGACARHATSDSDWTPRARSEPLIIECTSCHSRYQYDEARFDGIFVLRTNAKVTPL